MSTAQPTAEADLDAASGTLRLRCGGGWRWQAALPAQPALAGVRQLQLSADADLSDPDAALLAWLLRLGRQCQQAGIALDATALPERVSKLLALALAVPAQASKPEDDSSHFVERVGEASLRLWADLPRAAAFTGEIALSLVRLLRGRANFRGRDFLLLLEDCGPRALPIASLISFLVGTILAYMGAVQLAQFGAQIYIADLVAIGMVREVGALMTGVILAGRTGAAFAAQIGTMQVNEEIDALRSLGLSPIDMLVLPRLLALLLTVPLLTLYAGVVGIGAGMLIATTVFDVGVREYLNQTVSALSWTHILIGMFKGTVYGALVAFAGCLRGMQCGRSAQAVGEATTSAVVTSILLITVSASLLTIIFQRFGI
jgi:phospholipid/cholesterol/gamma-HCH transport system permease protein